VTPGAGWLIAVDVDARLECSLWASTAGAATASLVAFTDVNKVVMTR
jgi:hypothetical protein